MGLFNLFKKKQKDNNVQNINNYVIEIFERISVKCQYGDMIENLNQFERVVFITQSLESEVNNGGFSQFFANSSGKFANELVSSFTEIKAYKTAEICKKAVEAYDELEEDELEELLDECDSRFYMYEDDLIKLNYNYILQYKSFFLY